MQIRLLIVLVFLAPVALQAQEMRPLRDLTPQTSSTPPGGLVFPLGVYSGEMLFRQDGHNRGNEIWASDGTSAGTYLLLDANLQGDSDPQNAFDYNGLLLYTIDDGTHGTELWRSDGTPAGTYMLADINPGGGDSYPGQFTQVGSTVYFSAFDTTNGRELWKTDGTIGGTALVKDIFPGPTNSNPVELMAYGTQLIFVAEDDVNGKELYRSNGTVAGTVVVNDIIPGLNGSNPRYLTQYNGEIYFQARNASGADEHLFKSDGTNGGTAQAVVTYTNNRSLPHGLAVMGAFLYFFAKDNSGQWHLWQSDGTQGGTSKVTTGSFNNETEEAFVHNGILYFAANDGNTGYEPWRSDGTTSGTYRLVDALTGSNSSDPEQFRAASGGVVFRARDSSGFHKLWRTDGTTANTAKVQGGNGISADNMMSGLGKVFFNSGYDMWVSDGTDGGTILLSGTRLRGVSSTATGLVASGGEAYYRSQFAVWKTDGTWGGTERVNRTFDYTVTTDPFPFGSGVLFAAHQTGVGQELWFSDGTDAGTQLVIDLDTTTASASGSPQGFALWGSLACFTAYNGTSWGVYTSNGTAGGTTLLKDGFAARPVRLTPVGTNLFFAASDGANGEELWLSDGTTSGTVELLDINPGAADSDIRSITALNNAVYFTADNGSNGRELWTSDGTIGGTQLLVDFNSGPGDGMTLTADIAVMGGNLLFGADNGTSGNELWISDGTAGNTAMLFDIHTGTEGSYPESFAVSVGTAVFIAGDSAAGREVWRTDGTAGGTQLIADTWPGPQDGQPSPPQVANGAFWFTGANPVEGREIWTSNGTPGSTQKIAQTVPNADGLAVQQFFGFGGDLFFAGDDGLSGFELWIRTTDIAPHIAPTVGSNLFEPEFKGNELHYTASMGTPLSAAEFEVVDSSTGANLSLVVVTGTTNGITPPTGATSISSGTTFSFSGNPIAQGTTTFTLEVTDGVNAVQTFLVVFDVGPDDPPTLVVPTGSGFSLTDVNEMTFYAIQGEALSGATLELFDSTAGASVDVAATPSTAQNGLSPPGTLSAVSSGTLIDFTGTPAAPGTVTFTIEVDDGTSQVPWTIEIVTESNDSPQIALPSGSAFYTVSPGVYGYDANTTQALADAELEFTDPDTGALLLFSFSPGTVNGITPPAGAAGQASGTTAEFTGTPTSGGTLSWTVSVTDGYNSPVVVTVEFYVVVNTAPYALPGTQSIFAGPTGGVFETTIIQNQQIGFADITCYDNDAGASLDITVSPAAQSGITAPANVTGTSTGRQLLWNGNSNAPGTYDFILEIDDGIVVTSYTVRFIVVVNAAPYVELAPGSLLSGPVASVFSVQWTTGVPLTNISLRLRDPTPGDTLTFGAGGGSQGGIGPPALAGVTDGAIASFGGTPNSTGVFTFNMSVSDGVSTANYVVEFTISNTNSPPVILSPSGSVATGSQGAGFVITATTGTALANANLEVNDPNPGNTLNVLSITGNAPGVTNPGTSVGSASPITLAWTGTPSVAGSYIIAIEVEDNLGAQAQTTLEFQVTAAPEAPAFSSVPPTVAYADYPYSYNIQTTGNPTPTLTVTGNPSWLVLGATSLGGTPPQSDVGNQFAITLDAANGVGSDASQFFYLSVSGDDPPSSGGGGSGDDEDSGCVTGHGGLPLIVLFALAAIYLRKKRCAH